ncbi:MULTISPECIES: hypothetical protein [Staphylococcus]|jgi:hypothetical protein|uniref:hypothetical protein n=1 Tax=Staphylococcus TaxID=1279 RepID=UPI000A74E5BD|nr:MULTISPECIES: hypothetical protein [Staphylococcus]MDI1957431.1 hypothetical protein [Staphylococcus aureus]SUL87561.1 Uncharacterised protein [Staphylococcus aureus]GJF96927.1 hypothetical protein SASC252_23860 [Staphylococcus argenteus]GJG02222.1 hypothetical protein SASC254_23840 [Staphylococcus argenteus]GJG04879.1 hypothetical protein SASC256_23740 [Staphylococcus argenteus]
MKGIKAQLTDGTQVRILKVVNQNKPIDYWKVEVIDNNKQIFIINISKIQFLGGT